MFPSAAACLLLLAALAADEPSRTWTSGDGRTLEGAYVRVDGDNVVIRMASGEVSVPIERFVLADRFYARKQAALQRAIEEEKAGKEDQPSAPPAVRNPVPEKAPRWPASNDNFDNADENVAVPLNGESKTGLKGDREWTDGRGNKMKARFVRMHQGNVILQGRKLETVPFYNLSDDDQGFLRMNLEALGQADQIPNRPPPQQVAGNGNGGNGIIANGGPPPINPANQFSPPPPQNDGLRLQQEMQNRMAENERQRLEQQQVARANREAEQLRESQRRTEEFNRHQALTSAAQQQLQAERQAEAARLAEIARLQNQAVYTSSSSSSYYGGDSKPVRIFIPVGLILAVLGAIVKFCIRASNSE